MTTDPLLHIASVHAAYGDTVALHDVSLDIADNEFFALLGPSGCGKTTLLRCIAGFETPRSGRIELDGRNLVGMAPHRRPVNMMFQSYALFPHLSVEKNIGYGLEADRVDRAEARRRVREVMEVVGLEELAKRRPSQLSGGQRQRVALARAIVKRPRLLLLDEPLSALDRQVRASMQLELKRLQHEVGLTFVVVTHDQEEAMSMADRIAVLRDGRLEQLATPQELYASPASRFVAGFIGTANLLDGVAVADGVEVPQLGVIEAAGQVTAGDAATAVIRPEDVDLGSDAATARLRGTVVDTYFLGGMSTVSVQLASTGTLVLASVHGATRLHRGDEVAVRFRRATAVGRDESSPGQPQMPSGDPAAQEVSA